MFDSCLPMAVKVDVVCIRTVVLLCSRFYALILFTMHSFAFAHYHCSFTSHSLAFAHYTLSFPSPHVRSLLPVTPRYNLLLLQVFISCSRSRLSSGCHRSFAVTHLLPSVYDCHLVTSLHDVASSSY
jgi:hypothetical protein